MLCHLLLCSSPVILSRIISLVEDRETRFRGTCQLRGLVQHFFDQLLFVLWWFFALVGDDALGLRCAQSQAGAAARFFCGAEFLGLAQWGHRSCLRVNYILDSSSAGVSAGI